MRLKYMRTGEVISAEDMVTVAVEPHPMYPDPDRERMDSLVAVVGRLLDQCGKDLPDNALSYILGVRVERV